MPASSESTEWLLEEYKSIRAEIDRRSQHQHVYITAASTALAGLLALIGQYPDNSALLVAVSWIMATFGCLWADHHIVIRRLGNYIEHVLEPELAARSSLPAEKPLFGWHRFARKSYGRDESVKIGALVDIVVAYYFIVPTISSAIAFAIYFVRTKHRPGINIIALEALVMLSSIALLVHYWNLAKRTIRDRTNST